MTIETKGTKLTVEAPYHPEFPAMAQKLGGKWEPPYWVFDPRDEKRVRELVRDVYGTDGTSDEMLTIRAPAKVCDGYQATFGGTRPTSWWFAGREIAKVSGRDSGAKLGAGVVLISGKFDSGGSVKNPSCTYTVFEVRDVPAELARKLHAAFHGVTLLDAAGNVVAEATSEVPPVVEPAGFSVAQHSRPAEGMGSKSPRYEVWSANNRRFEGADDDLSKAQHLAEQLVRQHGEWMRADIVIRDLGPKF